MLNENPSLHEIVGDQAMADFYHFFAFSYHSLFEYDNAFGYYTHAMKYISKFYGLSSKEYGHILLNCSDLFASLKKMEEAILLGNEAIAVFRLFYEKSPILASALTNVAEYYCYQKNFSHARTLCAEALKIYRDEYGRFHELTKNCFNIFYRILHELGEMDTIRDLTEDWNYLDKEKDLKPKGISQEDINEITSKFDDRMRKSVEIGTNMDFDIDEMFGTLQNQGIDVFNSESLKLAQKELKDILRKKKLKDIIDKKIPFDQNPDEEIIYNEYWRIMDKTKTNFSA